jgi:hypothetical protein
MESRLAPGLRLIPEALASPSSVTLVAGVPAGPTASGTRAGELGVGPPSGPLSTSSRTETTGAAFAPAVPGSVTRAMTPTPDRAAQPGVSAVLTVRAQQAPLLIPTPLLGIVFGGPDEGSGTDLVPGFRPPAVRVNSVGGDGVLPGDETGDAEQAALPPSAGNQVGAPWDGGAQAQVGVRFWELSGDDCFADGPWAPDLAGLDVPLPGAEAESSGQTPAAATAVTALAVGAYVAARVEAEPRRRRPSLI